MTIHLVVIVPGKRVQDWPLVPLLIQRWSTILRLTNTRSMRISFRQAISGHRICQFLCLLLLLGLNMTLNLRVILSYRWSDLTVTISNILNVSIHELILIYAGNYCTHLIILITIHFLSTLFSHLALSNKALSLRNSFDRRFPDSERLCPRNTR